MPTHRRVDSRGEGTPRQEPDDDFLISSMLGGDAAALRALMDRYDRLVRYAALRASHARCLQDPHWIESIASSTWAGFVRSMRRAPENRPKSVAAYVTQIARNQTISAQRAAPQFHQSISLPEEGDFGSIEATLDEPVEILSKLELLGTLQSCLGELEPNDRTMVSQLEAITERRWRDAATALGISESTLRSRWKQTLERLRRCVERKSGLELAPARQASDS